MLPKLTNYPFMAIRAFLGFIINFTFAKSTVHTKSVA